jgi:NADH-quinone oxidoreductase subunit F
MPEIDLAPLRPVLEEHAPRGRAALLPALHAAQAIYGYLPEAVAAEIGQALGVPLADVFGVIDFYAHFHSAPVAKRVVHVCTDPVCAFAGSDALMKMMTRTLQHDEAGRVVAVTLERAPCLGLCEHAPALLVDEIQRGHVAISSPLEITEAVGQKPVGIVGGDISLLTRNCGQGRVTSLADYERGGGYQALRQALQRAPVDIMA